jgi:lipoprotein-releasing system ATP-binding protein
MPQPVLILDAIRRSFVQAGERLDVLRGATATIAAGELVALVGPSGAGKSTLLHIAGLLEKADGGDVVVAGNPTRGLSDGERTGLRRNRIGFVYQFHHLLPEFSAEENIILPQMIAGVPGRRAQDRAEELLARVGLGARLSHRPARLSGGFGD